MTPERSKKDAGPADAAKTKTQVMQWLLLGETDGPMAAADWLAHDIVPTCKGAIGLLTDPATSIEQFRQAKDAYKTMRIIGEHPADRRLGARLYLAAIAAALAYHNQRISSQSDDALAKALESLRDDAEQADALRHLARVALRVMKK